jgi:hypothetical protein
VAVNRVRGIDQATGAYDDLPSVNTTILVATVAWLVVPLFVGISMKRTLVRPKAEKARG